MKISTICFPIIGDHVYLAEKKEGFGEGFLNGYGGKLKEGETLLEGLIRELGEESTVTADPDGFEHVAEIDYYEQERHLFNCHIFFLRNWRGILQETAEMGPPQMFPLREPPLERMWKGDILWVPRIVQGERLRGFVVYEWGMKDIRRSEFRPL